MVKIGLIGASPAARVHWNRYRCMEAARVITHARAPDDARGWIQDEDLDADVYSDPMELIEQAAVDIVDICVPASEHAELIERAVSYGQDVICEAPIAGSLSEAAAIADTVGDSGVRVLPSHPIRFSPEYVEGRQQVKEGQIGAPGVVRTTRLFPGQLDTEWHDWYADERSAGSIFLDLAFHDLDYLQWTVGEVDRVFARAGEWEGGNHALTTLRFASGGVGYVETVRHQNEIEKYAIGFEMSGDEGIISFDNTDMTAYRLDVKGPSSENSPSEPPYADGDGRDGYHRQLAHLVECVENSAEPKITLEDSIASLRLSVAAEKSASRGAPVAIEEVAIS